MLVSLLFWPPAPSSDLAAKSSLGTAVPGQISQNSHKAHLCQQSTLLSTTQGPRASANPSTVTLCQDRAACWPPGPCSALIPSHRQLAQMTLLEPTQVFPRANAGAAQSLELQPHLCPLRHQRHDRLRWCLLHRHGDPALRFPPVTFAHRPLPCTMTRPADNLRQLQTAICGFPR